MLARRLKKQLQYNTLTKQKRLLAQKSAKTARIYVLRKGRINKNDNTWRRMGQEDNKCSTMGDDVHTER